MKESYSQKDKILSTLGLAEVMVDNDHQHPFNYKLFHRYTTAKYLDSERKQMDETYRMCEIILLHKASGLRLEYLTTESYYGDELRYRLRDMFIITLKNEKLQVVDVDFKNKIFLTANNQIPFKEVLLTSIE